MKEKLYVQMTDVQRKMFDAEFEYRQNLRMSRPGDITAAQYRLGNLIRQLLDEGKITTQIGTRFRMFLEGTKYKIETDQGTYEILFTLGFYPLQQYLISLPGGRLQTLPIAWDCVNKRWFHLYPKEQILSDDPLHWSTPLQNWNRMCADCHTTNLQKNFNPQTSEYKTTYNEINVGCAACHAPCEQSASRDRHAAQQMVRSAHQSSFQTPLTGSESVDGCVFCHARRRLLRTGSKPPKTPAADWFITELQDGNIYYSDGQLLEESFEHGSFLQSKMSSKGVGCSHCHEPHSLELRYERNRLCTQCHMPSLYDTPAHHYHTDANKPGTQCVECHFPQSNYMVIDPRRDHSIRKPSPALTLAAPFAAAPPNACSICHQDRTKGETLRWAADWVERWYADKRNVRVAYNPQDNQ